MTRRLLSLIVLGLVLLMLPGLLARAQGPDRFLVTLPARTPQERTALVAQGYDVWGATLHDITLLVSAQDLSVLQGKGYTPTALQALALPPGFEGYHDYAEMLADCKAWPPSTRISPA